MASGSQQSGRQKGRFFCLILAEGREYFCSLCYFLGIFLSVHAGQHACITFQALCQSHIARPLLKRGCSLLVCLFGLGIFGFALTGKGQFILKVAEGPKGCLYLLESLGKKLLCVGKFAQLSINCRQIACCFQREAVLAG